MLRDAWYKMTLRKYKTEHASSEEQAAAFDQEFKRLQRAVHLAECYWADLDCPAAPSFENKVNMKEQIFMESFMIMGQSHSCKNLSMSAHLS